MTTRILHIFILFFLLVIILLVLSRLGLEFVPALFLIRVPNDLLQNILARCISDGSLAICGLGLILFLLLLKAGHHPVMTLLLGHFEVMIKILCMMIRKHRVVLEFSLLGKTV
jgi:hypothetical protein